MYLLGVHLADHKLVRIALTNFYGISYDTANQLCARLSLHDRATVASLTESQITQLSAYLSSPGSIPARKPHPTLLSSSSTTEVNRPSMAANPANDALRQIKIEADLKRVLHANITHHRNVGTYRGRRHAAHLPVRGQRTSTNAHTAKKLNRLERRGLATAVQRGEAMQGELSLEQLLRPLARLRFAQHGEAA
ncbi:related to mitochondrial ribosomal protein S13 [Sporisorium reilianum f. sp. reilianum]|uniref:Small ribosomal subunit protein uS13m n=1 Tax=Sporisorium reilianum f. sp. reilianum TaxID=72559 RepID=A0A2N8UAL9_9BASI|nr:related to mitochondrial ribosomal protein S13 [Sporisorium reilianum f. sp. reilianum]